MVLTMEDEINGKEKAYSGRDRCEASAGRCAGGAGPAGFGCGPCDSLCRRGKPAIWSHLPAQPDGFESACESSSVKPQAWYAGSLVQEGVSNGEMPGRIEDRDAEKD